MENSLMGEGASDACLNIRGQGKEIKQEFKEALNGKREGEGGGICTQSSIERSLALQYLKVWTESSICDSQQRMSAYQTH